MGYKILVVDDEEDGRMVYEESLRPLNFEIVVACSGDEAIELVKHQDFDLVISDFNMPGMHGDELLKQLKVLRPDMPSILASGIVGMPDSTTPLFGEGYLLGKPFCIEQMMNAILTVLRPAKGVKNSASEAVGLC